MPTSFVMALTPITSDRRHVFYEFNELGKRLKSTLGVHDGEQTVRVESLQLGGLGTNCYLLDAGKGLAIVIDPGAEAERIVARLEERKLAPALIVVTHGHADHIGGIQGLRERYPDAKIAIGRADAPALTSPRINQSLFIGLAIKVPKADRLVDDGETIAVGETTLKVIATPGHTPGGVCLYAEDLDGKPALFSGDTLFRESVGRCDIAGGDWDRLVASLRGKLLTLPDATVVYPGHGPVTTIAHEKKNNPFIGEESE